MSTSLITATFNRAEQLFRGISTVLSQEVLPNEIVIVDDGSQDNTKDVVAELQKQFANIKYIYLDHPEPRISCIPHNIGIKQASGDFLIFTEPECLHIGNTIDQILKKMEQYPNGCPLATQIWTMGQAIYKSLSENQFEYPQSLLHHQYAMLVDGNMQNTNAPDSDWGITGSLNCFAGCLWAARKEWLLEIGGFDESFEGHGFDDWDLFHRLNAYGKSIVQCNDIAVIHAWHEKNYPYNLYEAADKNGKASEARLKAGEYHANIGKDWGVL